jgi:hypothetical protein
VVRTCLDIVEILINCKGKKKIIIESEWREVEKNIKVKRSISYGHFGPVSEAHLALNGVAGLPKSDAWSIRFSLKP